MEAKRIGRHIKSTKSKTFQQRILYLAKLSFKWEEEIKLFSDTQKPKEFINTRPAFQEVLKGALYQKKKDIREHKNNQENS